MKNEIIKESTEKTEKVENRPFFVPRVDIQYDDKETIILAEMPGVDQKNVEISLENSDLLVTGYCRLEVPDGYNLKWQEYRIGHYRKSFQINDRVDTTKITAVMKDGILKLVLPIKEMCKPIKIKVLGA